MADFCKQCSIEHFGEDFRELAGLSTAEDTAKGLFACGICEGCSGSLFDHEGICQGNCLGSYFTKEKHGVQA